MHVDDPELVPGYGCARGMMQSCMSTRVSPHIADKTLYLSIPSNNTDIIKLKMLYLVIPKIKGPREI
jgi:hypothetical protein